MSKKPFTQRKSFIAAVGAFLAALVGLVGYLMTWPAEIYPLVFAVVGAGLAVWRTGVGLPAGDVDHFNNRRGMARTEALGVIAAFALLALFVVALLAMGGCSSTVKTHAKSSTHVEIWRSDCKMRVTADGKEVFVLTADPKAKCGLKCPTCAEGESR